MIMAVVLGSSLVAICAQWMVSIVEFWYGGWARHMHAHFDDFASMMEPNNRCGCMGSCGF